GYDPLFIPEGYDESFGVLPESVKNSMSHRGRALEQFRAWFAEL
ncbi:MAG: non-canonical purine NTP pyrophosphatase, partial [Verrucomicrobiota bacterium]